MKSIESKVSVAMTTVIATIIAIISITSPAIAGTPLHGVYGATSGSVAHPSILHALGIAASFAAAIAYVVNWAASHLRGVALGSIGATISWYVARYGIVTGIRLFLFAAGVSFWEVLALIALITWLYHL